MTHTYFDIENKMAEVVFLLFATGVAIQRKFHHVVRPVIPPEKLRHNRRKIHLVAAGVKPGSLYLLLHDLLGLAKVGS